MTLPEAPIIPNTPAPNINVTGVKEDYEMPGWNVLLQGESGNGKTTSLRSLVTECGLELFVLFTENSMEILSDLPPDKVHYHYCPPAAGGIKDIIDSATIINQNSYEQLCKMKQGVNKAKYSQWISFVTAFADFIDDRTGEHFGDVDTWGPNRVLVIDGMKGMAIMSRDLMIGSKPVCTQGEYGVAMDNIERLVQYLTMSTKCHFVLISHLDLLVDEINGGMKSFPQALGKKLGPKLPPLFSDVILAKREKKVFTWSTSDPTAMVKSRNLPIADDHSPTFKLLHQNWLKKTQET